MPSFELETRTLESPDGTTIAYHDTGGDKPAVVLANGLGGPLIGWRHQIAYLSERYRFVSWDYRGLYGSSRPPGPTPRIDVPAHVDDLQLVLEATGIERAACMGWSMGVQVLLELYARDPGRIENLVLLNGTFGKPLGSVAIPLADRVIPAVVDRVRRHHALGERVLRRASHWPETVGWLKRLGLVGNTLDEELFREIAQHFGSVDLDIYLGMLRSLGDHDASHVLERLRVPTLVIAGERDAFTPRRLAEQMAARVPNGELLVVRGATHYTAVEYPELVNLRIEKFFREHGW